MSSFVTNGFTSLLFLLSFIERSCSMKFFSCAKGILSNPLPIGSTFNQRPTEFGLASAAMIRRFGAACKHFKIPAAPGAPAPVMRTFMSVGVINQENYDYHYHCC